MKDFALGNITDTEKEKLLTGGAKGMSTFMSYFLLSAIDRASDTSRALEIAKEYYGGMLKMESNYFLGRFRHRLDAGGRSFDEAARRR
ncbi:MAG: hypothetical protein ACLR06_11790 [Christensenellaceae bacterium]